MAYTPDPFAFEGTLDTSKYGDPVEDRSFGATGPAQDSGQPVAEARLVTGAVEAADGVCAAVADDPANLTSDREAYQAFVAARTRHSLAN